MFKRFLYKDFLKRLSEPRKFIQVLYGPRQVGKTTLIQQALAEIHCPHHYVSADDPSLQTIQWIRQQWDVARLKTNKSSQEALLVLDEIQKIPQWSDMVKKLWDEDTRHHVPLKVVLLGSASWLVQEGLSESLTGRFEIIPVTHWSYLEMKTAFQVTLPQYIYFGAYPGAASLIQDESRWKNYILNTLIETTLSRDIFLLTRVNKPALLRRLFQLGCEYSSQILSYQKMMGQLQDAGNTTTLAHYLDLLTNAGLITGLSKFSKHSIRYRASSPKLQALNTALITASSLYSFADAQADRDFWGRLVESAVGANLINQSIGHDIRVFYFREHNKEVDFVLQKGKKLIGIEVKSGQTRTTLPGMEYFQNIHHPQKTFLIGNQGLSLEDFFTHPIEDLF